MHSILRNKKYIGVYCYNGIEKANVIPRIVDDALFARVQERLASNKAAPSRTRATEEFLLTTKLFCGHCRAMMVGVSGTSRTGAKHHYYSCNTARLTRNCKKKNVKKALIEDSVIKAAAKQLTPENSDLIVKEVFSVCEEAQRNSEVQRLKTELKKLDKQKSNLMNALKMNGADNVITEMIFSEMRELAASQENLKIQLAKETSKILTISETEIRFFLFRLSSGNISEKRYKKALINIFINRIYLYDDGRADIYFNTQETPFTVDITNTDFNEASQIEGSCVTRNGSPKTRSVWPGFLLFLIKITAPLPWKCGKGAVALKKIMAHAWQFPQGAVRHGQKSAERLGKDNSGRCCRPAALGRGGSRRGTAAPTGKRGIPAPLSWTAQ